MIKDSLYYAISRQMGHRTIVTVGLNLGQSYYTLKGR